MLMGEKNKTLKHDKLQKERKYNPLFHRTLSFPMLSVKELSLLTVNVITIPGHKIGTCVNTRENIQAHVELSLKKKKSVIIYVLSYNLLFLTQHFIMGSHHLVMYMDIYPIHIFSAISFHNFFFCYAEFKTL